MKRVKTDEPAAKVFISLIYFAYYTDGFSFKWTSCEQQLG